jgi:hypothetical protein
MGDVGKYCNLCFCSSQSSQQSESQNCRATAEPQWSVGREEPEVRATEPQSYRATELHGVRGRERQGKESPPRSAREAR